MKIGYARVSTEDQNLSAQRHQLRRDGCTRVVSEKLTGRSKKRPALDRALASLKRGDMLVVWKLDRLGRSLQHLIEILQELEARGVRFRSISDGIDSSTPAGRMLFHFLGAIAEFEASLISERTKLGMRDAQRRGKQLGRPRRIEAHELRTAKKLRKQHQLSYQEIADRLNIGRTTLWREISRKSA